MTVTGRTVAENLSTIDPPDPDGKILRALNDPLHPTGGLTVLKGSLAPGGAVVKSAGFDADVFDGTARVFDREQPAMDAVLNGELKKGDRKSTRLNSSHVSISYAVFCLKKKSTSKHTTK